MMRPVLLLFLACVGSVHALELPADLTPVPVATGYIGLEGPAWSDAEQCLYFSEQVSGFALHRYVPGEGATVFAEYPNKVNGNLVLADGSLITCESGYRRLVRRALGSDTVEVLVDGVDGETLNEPNDVIEAPDGTLWFTTPNWPANNRMYVLSYDPVTQEVRKRVEGVVQPNGLGFSPDGAWFYLNAFGENRVIRYPVEAAGKLGEGETFFTLDGGPDGMTIDAAGNLYICVYSSNRPDGGLNIITPDGTRLARIPVPGNTTNCTFGGPHRQDLYITSGRELYRLDLSASYPVHPPAVRIRSAAPSPSKPASTVSLQWLSTAVHYYRIEQSTDLLAWERSTVPVPSPAQGGPLEVTLETLQGSTTYFRLWPVWDH